MPANEWAVLRGIHRQNGTLGAGTETSAWARDRARARAPVPAVALTAYARAEDRRRVFDAGFSMHVPKPVEPTELVHVLASLTRFKRPRA